MTHKSKNHWGSLEQIPSRQTAWKGQLTKQTWGLIRAFLLIAWQAWQLSMRQSSFVWQLVDAELIVG